LSNGCNRAAIGNADIAAATALQGNIDALFARAGVAAQGTALASMPSATYFVHRVIDADHLQRDDMEGPTVMVSPVPNAWRRSSIHIFPPSELSSR
jgi:hypothetical protein